MTSHKGWIPSQAGNDKGRFGVIPAIYFVIPAQAGIHLYVFKKEWLQHQVLDDIARGDRCPIRSGMTREG